MTGNITLAMRTAQSGLLASQEALGTVANNISNANTPGYSRKVAQLEQRVVSGTGAGVQLSKVTRQIDEGLLKSLRAETGTLGALESTQSYFARIQELFGSPADNTSLSHIVEQLTNSLETLALSPDRTSEQADAIRWATETAVELTSMTDTIQDLRLQADRAISDIIVKVNAITADIEDLNNKIIRNETIGNDVTDLKDKRDAAIDELSGYMNINYVTRSQGDVVVFTAGGNILVDNTAQSVTHVAASGITADNTYEQGHFNEIFVGGTATSNDITSRLTGGELKGLVDMRDNILPGLQAQLDEFASELRDQFNLIHNRGTPFPGMQDVVGNREFVDSANQTITFSSGDTTMFLLDSSGNQSAATTLVTELGGTGPHTIDAVAAAMQTWYRANGAATATVAVNADRKFEIDLNNTALYTGFRDETATANGSTHSDVTIGFNLDGDAGPVIDQNISGFSNFFELNNFFDDGLSPTIHDSAVKLDTYSWEPAADVTLTFEYYNATTATVVSNTSTFTAASAPYTLQEIADQINDSTNGISWVTATVIQDGSGQRLRFTQDDSVTFTVADNQGVGGANSFIEAVGMEASASKTASFLNVVENIRETPGQMSHGSPQWDASLGAAGEYYMSQGDPTITQALAEMMTSSNTFETAGGLNGTTVDMATYSASIISYAASEADKNEVRYETQKSLKDSLELKSDNLRGVNLDEEMSDLLLYQQSYAAAARLITTIKSMFDALDRAVS
ncbi:MAG: flagellar hook-associated protein FlgK [Alphaproteobacteria bacterium]|nr:flagellar hook-associated protein FlgK [Rhodospirillales bacterium]MCW9045824.1 flagellar hook-associated protein FlgK [Alphaproteobacteria bacterium]